MKPFCRINSGGMDLTGGLADRLLSIEVRDEAEDKSDRVTIELDDRARFSDGAVTAIPAIGLVVNIVMGFEGGPAGDRGTYQIDSVEVSGGPRTLRVSGRSAAMSKSYRTPRTQSYHQTTLGKIIKEIAGRNGYQAVVDPEMAGVVVRHIDQHNESDMAFATRLTAMHDGVARPVDGKIVAAKRGTGKSISGQPLPVIVLTEADLEPGWKFSYSAREEAGEASGLDGEGADQQAAGDAGAAESAGAPSDVPGGSGASGTAGGVRALWTDLRTGERKEVKVGSAPYHDMRFGFHNEAEAKAAATSFKNQSDRGNASFSCTVGGRPDVQAEAILMLPGLRPYIPVAWRIKSAAHRFDGGGYRTSITAELFKQEQDSPPAKVGESTPSEDDLIDPDAPPEPVEAQEPGGSEFIIDLPE